MAGAVLRYSSPVHGLRSKVTISEASDHITIPAFRIGIFLPKESHPTQAVHQSGREIAIWQIAFQARALLTIAIEQEHRWRPDCIEAVEPGRMFFYVSFDGKEVRMNEIGSLLICIRLGIQPSTCPSSRSCTEVEQDRARLLFGCGEGLIDVLAPVNGHVRLLLCCQQIKIVSSLSRSFCPVQTRQDAAPERLDRLRQLGSDRSNKKYQKCCRQNITTRDDDFAFHCRTPTPLARLLCVSG
jgi:hypothetical protein